MGYPKKNPLNELDNVPPFLAHVLAINNGGKNRFTLDEIVARSGLKERTYLRTIRMLDWQQVRKEVIERVLLGTGVNPWRFKRHRKFLRKHGATLRWVNMRQKNVYLELCAKWLEKKEASNQGDVKPESTQAH